jgi:diguanylate cyclase (GGDEF)-like protein
MASRELTAYVTEVHTRVYAVVQRAVPTVQIQAWGELQRAAEKAHAAIAKAAKEQAHPVDGRYLPLIKRAILSRRAIAAQAMQEQLGFTINSEIATQLRSKVQMFDKYLAALREVNALPIPGLSDYLTYEAIAKLNGGNGSSAPRQFDEKFHILQAPGQFGRDLAAARDECGLRGVSLAIAYIDIDDFKRKFNSPLSETVVDAEILPRFMRTMEARTYSHGYAYRFGGDEYVVLLRNMSNRWAFTFMDDLRTALCGINYGPVTAERTTVSIGVVMVDPDSPFSEQELLDKASAAKAFAKKNGKNQSATYADVDLMSLVATEPPGL